MNLLPNEKFVQETLISLCSESSYQILTLVGMLITLVTSVALFLVLALMKFVIFVCTFFST